MRNLLICLAAIAALVPAAACAQGRNDKPAQVVDDLLACRAIADSAQRLACFDRTAATLGTARESKKIVILDREGVRDAKRSVFGFSLPNIHLFGGGDDEPQVTEINDTIVEAREVEHGFWVIRLKDGGMWQTTETRMSFDAKAGQTIRIKAGALGSYKAWVGGGRVIAVKRLR